MTSFISVSPVSLSLVLHIKVSHYLLYNSSYPRQAIVHIWWGFERCIFVFELRVVGEIWIIIRLLLAGFK